MGLKDYTVNLLSLKEDWELFSFALEDAFFRHGEGRIHGGSVDVSLRARRISSAYELELQYDGEVEATCDRCLDPVVYDVAFDRAFVVKLEDIPEIVEDEDIIHLPLKESVLHLGPIMREDLELDLPIILLHEEGDCNTDMMQRFNAMEVSELHEEPAPAKDERWAKLEGLKASLDNGSEK